MIETLIYLLEDCEEDAYIVKRLMGNSRMHTFKLREYSTIGELEKAINILPPDIIITDMNLPESKGLNTVVEVKRIAGECPIIVLTGFEDDTTGYDAIQLGAQDFIPKAELTGNLLKRSIRFSMERFNLLKNLEEKSVRDSLTLLHNRNAFEQRLAEVLSEVERYEQYFGLLFFDVNEFKEINDMHGHLVGDQVLKSIATRLNLFKRASDFVARFGGDEFVMIVKNVTSADDLENIAKTKHQSLNDTYSLASANKTLLRLELSVSVGAALYKEHGKTYEELIESADKAMYCAKKNGQGWSLPAERNLCDSST